MAMSSVRHILVAVDRFPQSKPVLARAMELGRAHNARVSIVHIVDTLREQEPGATGTQLVEEHALALAREQLENAIRTHDLLGITPDIHVHVGPASSRVVEIANDLGVELIVLRAHQRQSIREKLIGSTADRIIRAASSSILVVRCPAERAYQNILVAIDFSDDSESSAILSAGLCFGLRLQLVHIVHVSPRFEEALMRAGSSREKIAAFRHQVAGHARDRMRQLARQFAGRQPAPRTRVIEGEPARTLVRLTRSKAVDLIAVGPYEHGVVRTALLGSVTQRLLREAACDVLISRPSPVAP